MTPYDNRYAFDRDRAALILRNGLRVLRGRRRGHFGYKRHFAFEVDGRRFVYAYINKNACTAFKDFIVDRSPMRTAPVRREEKMRFMLAHHLVDGADGLRADDTLIFVYRDPVQRFASLFNNKFVMHDGHADVFANYRRLTGADPERASAQRVVEDYLEAFLHQRLRGLGPRVDRHFVPQRMCLAPVRYDAAISMADLHKRMTALIGDVLADRYFATPRNAAAGNASLGDVSQVPATELAEQYRRTGTLPRGADVVNEAMRARLSRLYSVDLAMIEAVEASA